MSVTESAQRGAIKTSKAEQRRVLAATLVGTTVEWYDFFIYAFVAAMLFGELFFKPLGPTAATLTSFATIGLSFLFRPLGAFLAGHFGDKFGRKPILIATLILMGIATSAIGLLPTGNLAATSAFILIFLRILQGISAGGEWGGAILMAVETAPLERRNRAGAWPQLGVPFGMLLATSMLTILQLSLGKEQFAEWGWRIAFLFSIVLIIIGYIVRRMVEESPVFKQIAATAREESAPIPVVFKKHWLIVILAALVFAGDNAVGYMLVGGVISRYSSTPLEKGGLVGMEPGTVSLLLNIAAIAWAIFTYLGAYIADKTSAKRTFIIGYILMIFASAALFPLVVMAGNHPEHGTGNPIWFVVATVLLALPLGFCYGPLSAWYAEVFPASVRFSGVSITYAIGAIIGGAFAPLIVQAIFENNANQWFWAAVYLVGMSIVGLIGSVLLRDRKNIPLGLDMEQSGQWPTWRTGDPVPKGVNPIH